MAQLGRNLNENRSGYTTMCYFASSPISEEPKDWKISLKGLNSLWVDYMGNLKEADVK